MRTLVTTVAALLAAGTLAAAPADAQQRSKRSQYGYSSSQSNSQWNRSRADADSFTSGRRGDTKDDIDARAADPGGDYASYPSWARKALGGNKDLGH